MEMPEIFNNLDVSNFTITYNNESSSTAGFDNSILSATILTSDLRQRLLNSNEVFSSASELLTAIVYCLSQKYF